MYSYTFIQWLLFFYTYCFLGWIWETAFVSIKQKKFVNRGFLTGPFLPIYGSGAIIVLLATIPVKDNLWHVYWMGLIAATILEYVTGALMEKLFKVRYWDYSGKKFNLHGYICLTSSIAWGFFSIIMIQYIHKPIENLFFRIPNQVQDILAVTLTVALSVDLSYAVRDALDLKEMLVHITENSEEIQKLQKRLDYLMTVLEDEKEIMMEKIERIEGLIPKREELEKEIQSFKERIAFAMEKLNFRKGQSKGALRLLKRNPGATSKAFSKALLEIQNIRNGGEDR